jgi:hypothetical protein
MNNNLNDCTPNQSKVKRRRSGSKWLLDCQSAWFPKEYIPALTEIALEWQAATIAKQFED